MEAMWYMVCCIWVTIPKVNYLFYTSMWTSGTHIFLRNKLGAGRFFTIWVTREAHVYTHTNMYMHTHTYIYVYMSPTKVEVTQLCPTLCDPMDCSLPGSSVHLISQVRVLEWTAISFSRGSSRSRDQTWVRFDQTCLRGRFFIIWATREAPINIF